MTTVTVFSFKKRGINMKRVYDFLKKAEVYYLATVEGDQPRVRPFGTVNEFEGRVASIIRTPFFTGGFPPILR